MISADRYATSFRVAVSGAASSIMLLAQQAIFFLTQSQQLNQGEYWRLRQIAGLFLQTIGFLLHPQHPDMSTSGKPTARISTAHLLDLLTFSWERKIFHKLRESSTSKDKLPLLSNSLHTGHLMRNLPDYRSDQKLWTWLLHAYSPQLLKQWVLVAMKAVTQLVPQYALFYLLQALEQNQSDRSVTLYSVLYGLSLIAEVWIRELVQWFTMSQFQIPMQAVLSSLVYRKTLKLPNFSEGQPEDRSSQQQSRQDPPSLTKSIDNHLQLDT